jgi:hypothetical protein
MATETAMGRHHRAWQARRAPHLDEGSVKRVERFWAAVGLGRDDATDARLAHGVAYMVERWTGAPGRAAWVGSGALRVPAVGSDARRLAGCERGADRRRRRRRRPHADFAPRGRTDGAEAPPASLGSLAALLGGRAGVAGVGALSSLAPDGVDGRLAVAPSAGQLRCVHRRSDHLVARLRQQRDWLAREPTHLPRLARP